MKKALIASIVIMAAFSINAMAQDPGAPDSIIIGTVSVPQGAPSVMVPVYVVSDDSVASLNLPLRWNSFDGKINPGGAYYFGPLLHWDEISDTIDMDNHRMWIHGMNDTGGDDNPIIHTVGNRLQIMLIRMVIHTSALNQFVTLMPYIDSTNGGPFFALDGSTVTFAPAVVSGGVNYQYGDIDEQNNTIPGEFQLAQNYPNPFNAHTDIRFTLANKSHVTLDIFDLLGRRVKTLVNGSYDAGIYTANWDGTDGNGDQISSGIYFYSIRVNDNSETHKMVLLK
jgi:hypothetical protein